jgi:hypothetical protein
METYYMLNEWFVDENFNIKSTLHGGGLWRAGCCQHPVSEALEYKE